MRLPLPTPCQLSSVCSWLVLMSPRKTQQGKPPFDLTTFMEIRQLLLAASNGDHTPICQLVEGGVSPLHEFHLHEACEEGHEEAIKVLIDLGADVNKQLYLTGSHPSRHEEIVEFLLSVGADTEECDSHGNTVQERVE